MKRAVSLAIVLGLLGCGRNGSTAATTSGGENGTGGAPDVEPTFCEHRQAGLEVAHFDTNSDGNTDVIRVFRVTGSGAEQRRVLVCREADLNGDGTRDVVRYYSDEGRPLREQADRDFDGRPDQWDFFEDGRIIRVESDSNGDARVDTKTFYTNGQAIRIERDVGGHSSGETWQPDRWEYYEAGRMIRIGFDEDGDGRVDRWDRDEIWQDERRRQQAEALRQQQGEQDGTADDEDQTARD